MTWAPGPAVTRLRLGKELRDLREGEQLKLEDVARQLECSQSKISRLEIGKGLPRWRDVRDLLDIYGVDEGEQRERLLAWAQVGASRAWWSDYSDVLGTGLSTYIELEWDAKRLEAFEPSLIHALLQTYDYAAAVLRELRPDRSGEEIDRLAAVRMSRQETLTFDHGLTLHCILDQSALHRVVGGRAVMSTQLQHLLTLAEAPHVSVQVLPFAAGPAASTFGSFTRLSFSEGIDPDLVFLERTPDEELIRNPETVAFYAAKMNQLAFMALSERESLDMIKDVLMGGANSLPR